MARPVPYEEFSKVRTDLFKAKKALKYIAEFTNATGRRPVDYLPPSSPDHMIQAAAVQALKEIE
jgi:hypothetical protein